MIVYMKNRFLLIGFFLYVVLAVLVFNSFVAFRYLIWSLYLYLGIYLLMLAYLKDRSLFVGLLGYFLLSACIYLIGMISGSEGYSFGLFHYLLMGPASFLIGPYDDVIFYLISSGIVAIPFYYVLQAKRSVYRIVNMLLFISLWMFSGFVNPIFEMLSSIG